MNTAHEAPGDGGLDGRWKVPGPTQRYKGIYTYTIDDLPRIRIYSTLLLDLDPTPKLHPHFRELRKRRSEVSVGGVEHGGIYGIYIEAW